jgi:hypothetical protein
MPRARLYLIAFLTLFAFGAACNQASASVWHVNGADLIKSEALLLASTAALASPAIFNFPSSNAKIECSGSPAKFSNSHIEGEGNLSITLALVGCKMLKPSGCSLASEELSLRRLEGLAGPSGTKEGSTIVSNLTQPLVSFSVTGTGCALAGEVEISPPGAGAALRLKLPNGQEELSAQATEANNDSLYLELRGKTYLEAGRALLKLLSEEKFSAVSTKGWRIAGTELAAGSTAALNPIAPLESNAIYALTRLNTKVECTNPLLLTNPYIQGGFTLHASALKLMGCHVLTPAGCTLTNAEPSTSGLDGTVTIGTSPEDQLTLNSIDLSFNISGSECPVAGEQFIFGSLVVGLPAGQEEHVQQPIEGLGENEPNGLIWIGSGSYEGGLLLLKLQSGSKFSVASGPGWHINNSELPRFSKQALTSLARADAHTVFRIGALPAVKIECKATNLGIESGEAIGVQGIRAQLLAFEGCETVEPKSGCKTSQKINASPLLALAAIGNNPKDTLTLTPNSKKPLLTISFQEECGSFSGATSVNGSVGLTMPTGQTETTLQAIEGRGSTENNSLEIAAGIKVYIEGGKDLLGLTNGSKWSFH